STDEARARIGRAGLGAEVELIATAGEVVLKLAKRLVLFVGDPGHGQLQGFADLGNRPAARPELDDSILARSEYSRSRGLEDLSELVTIPVALIEVGTRRELIVERLIPLRPLHALADHVDRPDELATFGRVVRQHEVEIELARPCLAEQPAADL